MDEALIEKTALNLLSRREHSRQELLQKLLQRGFDQNSCLSVIDKLQHKNCISHERYVEMLLRARQARGYGPRRIVQELQQKGIEAQEIAQVPHETDAMWFVVAQRAYRKKFGDTPPHSMLEKQKRQRYLYDRGFCMEHIQLLSERHDKK